MNYRTCWLTAVLMMIAPVAGNCAEPGEADLSVVDHLVYSAPDLDDGIEAIEKLTGIRATIGGSHPGMGTRNALISLGPATYLEIIAPDPAQSEYRSPRLFRIDEVDAPRLVTWAAKGADIPNIASISFARGQNVGAAMAGSRDRPDGITLAWELTDPYTEIADGVVPFFIDWGDTPHPAGNSPPGAILAGLRAEHPRPDRVRSIFEALGVRMPVSAADTPALIAVIDSPKGRIELR